MKDSVRFIHISDSHIGLTPEWDSFGNNAWDNTLAIVDYINTELPFEPDFILHTGDVVFNPKSEAYPQAVKLFEKLRWPVYYVRGNHDTPDAMRQYLPNLPIGEGHLDYDFVHGDFHFVVLDTFGHTSTSGYVEDNQLAWLEKTLHQSTARSIVMAMHHLPLISHVPCLDELMIIQNHDALFDVLRPHRDRIRGLFYGHIHRDSLAIRDGILCSSAPALWFQMITWPNDEVGFKGDEEALPGFKIVTINHQQTFVTSHSIPKP